jgi:hypothetical protein
MEQLKSNVQFISVRELMKCDSDSGGVDDDKEGEKTRSIGLYLWLL